MQNPIMNLLMTQLRNQNPQAYQMISNAMNSGANPQQFMNQIIGNATPQQMEQVLQMGKRFNVPDSVLNQIQNNK